MKKPLHHIRSVWEGEKERLQRTGLLAWTLRIVLALGVAFTLGGLPVYVVHEYRATRLMEQELRQLIDANERMVDEIEKRRMELRMLKTGEGYSKALRDKGFVPKGSQVYTIAR